MADGNEPQLLPREQPVNSAPFVSSAGPSVIPMVSASREGGRNLSPVTENYDVRPQPIPNASDRKQKTPTNLALPATNRSGKTLFRLPDFIQPPSREFDDDELELLTKCGALSLPETSLQDQLFLAFLLYVYPSLPILDVQDFIDAVEQRRPGCRVSLILFQAIMFSGTAFVPIEALREAGFESRIAARAYFLRKIKVRNTIYIWSSYQSD